MRKMSHTTTVSGTDTRLIHWLLKGDVSVQYQVHRDLLDSDTNILKELQRRIETEGWGSRFLDQRHRNGHWGLGLYQPKWTSTHYTLLDLRNLCFPPGNSLVEDSLELVLTAPKGIDGGLNLAKTIPESDVCVNRMVLNYSTWFLGDDNRLKHIVGYLLDHQMKDGGWNCDYLKGAARSSLHSTISVLEGLQEWKMTESRFLSNEIANAIQEGEEFILRHHLFR